MKTNEQLLISYAGNRIALRNLSQRITSAFVESYKTDLAVHEVMKSCRENYFCTESDDYEQPHGNYDWPGWDTVLCDEDSPLNDISDSDKETILKIGFMFDCRKTINNEAGKIKTAIASRGRALMRATP